MNQPATYNKAVETIKPAILQGQYEASKGVNRIQLAVYFGIGKYISLNTRKGVWGTGALEAISQQLRKELPGLRGFAPSSMKNMRQFYEEWAMLDANSPIAIGELNVKNFIMTFGNDFAFIGNQYHLEVYGVEHFPDLLFFNRELNALVVVELKTGDFKSSYLGQLMSYLSILDAKVKKPHENPSIGIVLCKSAKRDYVEFVIRDYNKPMGVATYKTTAEMPEELRKALPDIEELKKLL